MFSHVDKMEKGNILERIHSNNNNFKMSKIYYNKK